VSPIRSGRIRRRGEEVHDRMHERAGILPEEQVPEAGPAGLDRWPDGRAVEHVEGGTPGR
jgi:hypothetical protein